MLIIGYRFFLFTFILFKTKTNNAMMANSTAIIASGARIAVKRFKKIPIIRVVVSIIAVTLSKSLPPSSRARTV